MIIAEDMKCLVTGAAGFIGSHISERLVDLGYEVVGVDCFTDYYAKELKKKNIERLISNKKFTLIEKDLVDLNLRELLEGVDYIFHEAAQPGVRKSWGDDFSIYIKNNVNATQKLLEACKNTAIEKLVFASSSSIYGDVKVFPMKETLIPRPISPYGVSKLAGEHLCYLYWKNYGIPVISLRYFTVYGPRQRPDMAFNRFITSILKDTKITIFGNGEQTRDFTFVSDVVDANILAMTSDLNGEIFNIGGGSRITVNEAICIIEEIIGKKATIEYIKRQKGDVEHTFADVTKAQEELNYRPRVDIKEGLIREVEWIKNLMKS